jgi:hypothetical protein
MPTSFLLFTFVNAAAGWATPLVSEIQRGPATASYRSICLLLVNPPILAFDHQAKETTIMLKLMIECSRTGHIIPTGIETDTRSFSVLTDFEAKTYCPYCKALHRWSKRDVCLTSPDIHALH